MDSKIITLLILAGIGAVMGTAVWNKSFKNNGGMKTFFAIASIALLAYGLVGTGAQLGWYELPQGVDNFFLSAGVPSGTGGDGGAINCPAGTTLKNGVCVSTSGGGATYQPTGSYSSKDKFATTVISGTSYYKVNDASATTTAQTNLNVGDSVTYWVDNATYWVQPATKTAGSGVTPYEALGYANSSATLTLYDVVNKQPVTNGAYNTSMGANGQANIEITYQGTAKGSAGPFGGLMVLEYNSTMASVLCTGEGVLLNTNPYHLTFTPTATSLTYKVFPYGPSLDDGTGNPRYINCQYKNGATAVGAGSPYYVYFIPANYYVSINGDILLDTEKYADSDTTRTGSIYNRPSATAYWGA